MQSEKLPAVLIPPAPNSPISIERALRQVYELLENFAIGQRPQHDRIDASLDDIDVMLKCIER